MIRIVLENILLFLLPSLLYLAYVMITREDTAAGGKGIKGAAQVLNDAPLLWLFVAGAALVIVTLVAFEQQSGGRPGQRYEPPVLKDGKIEPGRID